MVLHNPNNWHWVNKDVSGWAKDFLAESMVGVSAEEGDVSAKIDGIMSMDGDVDVSQRKGKVITLFDIRLQLEWSGKAGEETTASGTITIPEVAHDTEADEYVFDISLYSESSEKEPIKNLVRSKIVPQLRTKLQKLAPALIAEHGKDIQHAPGSNPSSGFSTPKYISSSHISKDSSKPSTTTTTTSSGGKGPSVNVTTVNDEAEFRTTAEQLYKTFTDPDRIAAFTRSKPNLFEGAKKGGKFELFGGNITGEYVELEEPTKVVQKWRLAQWPQGHYATLKIRFEQNDVDAVTTMRVDIEGVPVGQEEVTKRNWGEYYVRSIKTTFGFGTVL
ncbi:uncharacterized protein PV09_06594 [Verruconis gallopava]|uniref:Activator of Hsp90 ATPase AHSA1-like N-terminal domain-containing protein n=1 Tax=Verruconis gallopava TaxID=253628 RepID=A0A0D2ASF7_9PEZI|nr:uncharacterized protein PV09_06594 [Verruconis gallopava]KIW02104.1 hypothetical protein PV09_06594 [Verruconis gallopava]